MQSLYHKEAEQAVLGACLIDEKAIFVAEEIVEPDSFADMEHQLIMRAILRVKEKGISVDIVTVVAELNDDEMNLIGGVEYLARLASSCPTSANVDHYAEIVREKQIARITHRTMLEAAAAIENGEDPAYMAAQVEDRARKMQSRNDRNLVHVKDTLLNTFERIEHSFSNKGALTGVASGFPDLDKMTAGFQRSDLIIVAARPAVGKTAFAVNLGQNIAKKNEIVAIFSLEMGRDQLVQRMLCAEAHIDAGNMRTGLLEEADWPRLTMAVGVLSEASLFIDDTPGIKISEIRSKARKLKEQQGDLRLIIIDYLQLIEPEKKTNNRTQEVSEISRGLKLIARELDCTVIALSQLSRSVEQRQDKRPMLSDLRESGSIEQDADIVAFLYRDDYYNPESERRNLADVIIAKQRSGPTGTVELVYLKNYNKFVSLERHPATEKKSELPATADEFFKEERSA